MEKRELLVEMSGEDLLFFTDEIYDKALIGYAQGCRETVAVYDMDLLVQTLIGKDMSEDEAKEHIHFNILASSLGDKTPMVLSFI